MKRVLPAPLLSLALFALWLVLNESLGAAQLLLALLIAIGVPWLCAPLRPLPVRIRRPRTLLRLIGNVGRDVLVSNWTVATRVLRAGSRPPRSAFVKIPLQLHDANALAALAVITTVVPGTVWTELALDGSVLMLHVFDVDDESAFIAHFKQRYEQPLMDIFE